MRALTVGEGKSVDGKESDIVGRSRSATVDISKCGPITVNYDTALHHFLGAGRKLGLSRSNKGEGRKKECGEK